MARMLFLPLFLIVLAAVIFLVLRLKSMFALGKSRDITLSRPSPYGEDVHNLIGPMLSALDNLPSVEYQSEIHVDFRKVLSYSKTGLQSAYNRITAGTAVLEITRENQNITVKTGKSSPKSISRENRWVDFWCGTGTLAESLGLFREDGMKVMAGNVGSYMQRNYAEVIILAQAMSPRSNQAFAQCAGVMGRVYGKNLSEPDVKIRNFMMRILVNNITSMPDYIEIKFNIFRGSDFVCDYLQNSRLLY
ncbi:MAG: hypothetical protein ACOY40_15945 [Bacillota bacterium]